MIKFSFFFLIIKHHIIVRMLNYVLNSISLFFIRCCVVIIDDDMITVYVFYHLNRKIFRLYLHILIILFSCFSLSSMNIRLFLLTSQTFIMFHISLMIQVLGPRGVKIS
jgi:hypothetical protein